MEKDIRNIAIIAHVDHGKTTLVDALLKQTHTFRENQEEMSQTLIMDSNELERERGITILAKNCAIQYKNTKINIIDTPGHADFSGEVERTLGMADGALLIVDAQEGPMPQTRFVLKKALELGLKIIVVINKIDKKYARPAESLSNIETLFLELAKEESQLDFPIVYAIGRSGVAFDKLPSSPDEKGDIFPLLDKVIEYIPKSKILKGPFKMVATSIDYDEHVGRIVIGKVHQGEIKKGMKVTVVQEPNSSYKIEKLWVYDGLNKTEVDEAQSGDIVSFAGIENIKIGNTVSDPSDLESLPGAVISEPTLHMLLGPNTSPFSGRDGKFYTSRQIEERLNKELESNLSLRVEKNPAGKFKISGRGELHLSILLETMRREGYEMEVGKPEVIIKEKNGEKKEPYEEVSIIVPGEYVGVITEEMGKRSGNLVNMGPLTTGETEFIYHAPTRVLLGLRTALLTLTKGTIVYNSIIIGYEKMGKSLPKLRRGVLIADQAGETLAYGLENAQQRGTLFVGPATNVYEGMIVGLNAKEEDISMNVCKGKKLTNMRSKASDGVLQLTPPTEMSLEQCLDFLEDDELLEITPHSLRLRKKILSALERKRSAKN
jgi:GTP-binding protein